MRGKTAQNDNRVIGVVVLLSSALAVRSLRAIQCCFTPLHMRFTPYRVYRVKVRRFKREVRKLCREQMEPYFKRWKVGL